MIAGLCWAGVGLVAGEDRSTATAKDKMRARGSKIGLPLSGNEPRWVKLP
jgi:hypothetical protein